MTARDLITPMPFDDQIKLMLRQAQLAEHEATEIVFHPTDWAEVERWIEKAKVLLPE